MTDKIKMNGPLRYKVGTSSPQLEAGKDFSIFVRITNPFSTPVKIRSVTTKLPVDFYDLSVKQDDEKRDQLNKKLGSLLKTKIKEIDSVAAGDEGQRKKLLKDAVEEMVRILPMGGVFNASYKVAQAVSASSIEPSNKILNEIDDAITPEDIESITKEVDGKEKPLEALKESLSKITKEKLKKLNEVPSIELQPVGEKGSILFYNMLNVIYALLDAEATENRI